MVVVRWRMPVILGMCASTILAANMLAEARDPIACGNLYSVTRGDTLRMIAQRAYQNDDYLTIFEANRDVLTQPGLIEVGDLLFIPCLDGTGPQSRSEALAQTRASLSGGTRVGIPDEEDVTGPTTRTLLEPVPVAPALPAPTRARGLTPEAVEAVNAETLPDAPSLPRAQLGSPSLPETGEPAVPGSSRQVAEPEAPAIETPADETEAPEVAVTDPAPTPVPEATPTAPAAPEPEINEPGETVPETAAADLTAPEISAPDSPAAPSVPKIAEPTLPEQPSVGELALAEPTLPSETALAPQAAPSTPRLPNGLEPPQPSDTPSTTEGPEAPSLAAPSAPAAPASPGLPAVQAPSVPQVATIAQPSTLGAASGSADPVRGTAPEEPNLRASLDQPEAYETPVIDTGATDSAPSGLELAAAGDAGLAPALPQTTARPTCGAFYEIRGGDSLSKIALEVYGAFRFQQIFDANRDILSDPSFVEIGDLIFIPCEDGTGPRTRTAALAATEKRPVAAPTPQAAERPEVPAQRVVVTAPAAIEPPTLSEPVVEPAATEEPSPSTIATASPTAPDAGDAVTQPFRPVIRFLTGTGRAPLTGEDLPKGGLITDLVERSMEAADPSRLYRVTFIDDWQPHLETLLPDGAFDIGFGWFKPDCTKMSLLSTESKGRCTDFVYSNAFYELVVSTYALADSPFAAVTDAEGLKGSRVCRPEGYMTFDLEEIGLNAETVTMLRPRSAGDCFALLRRGQVDVVTMNELTAEDAIAWQSLTAEVVALDGLSSIRTVHAASAKSNPFGRTYLELLNQGLRKLQASNAWFDVVAFHLKEHAERTK